MAEWPEKFVYVFSATQGAATNAAPIAQAGAHRVAKAYVLVGAPDKGPWSAQDLRHAIGPLNDFKSFAQCICDQAGIPPFPIIPIHGHQAHFDHWAKALKQICTETQSDPNPVLFNITSGSKPMAIGGMLGSDGNVRLLYVDGETARPRFVSPDFADDLLSQHADLNLDQYLAAYGFLETQREDRIEGEAFFTRYEQAINRFAHEMRAPAELPRILNGKVGSLYRNEEFVPGEISFRGETERLIFDALRELRNVPGIELNGRQVRVTSRRAADLLRGGWLEGWLFNCIKRLIGNRDDAKVFANVKAARFDGNEQLPELDVVLLIRSQLHLFEAKTANLGNLAEKHGEKSLRQITSHRHNLIGNYAEVALVNPAANATVALESGQRVARAGVDWLVGAPAMSKAEAIAREILKTPGAKIR